MKLAAMAADTGVYCAYLHAPKEADLPNQTRIEDIPGLAKSPTMGHMMQMPLLISDILRHAARHHGHSQIVSKLSGGEIHRSTYGELHQRSKRLANGLAELGIRFGDRVATLAWNDFRHLEVYYAASGSGAVLHTVNPRLHPDQIVYIVNHASDRILMFDAAFLPLVEACCSRFKTVTHFILLSDRAHMPATTAIPNLLCHEDLIDQSFDQYEWPDFDENSASSLCYTSGTTGDPKGVMYSHRTTILHSYASLLPDAMNISVRDTVLPVVPMFHANAWGLPYLAPLVGAKLVLPGGTLDGASLYALMEAEGVTFAAGVPTVWLGLLNHVAQHDLRFSSLKRTLIGGSACPASIMDAFRNQHQVQVLHAWGMTEMSPLGTLSTLLPKHDVLPEPGRQAVLQKQGRAVFGVDMKIVDDAGSELPWDGKSAGHLLVRGQWVIREYFNAESDGLLKNGWLETGDVATIDADGYMQITDRHKDVVKSGGEWISTIDLENIAMSHQEVLQAACIGIAHPRWDERPLLIVVKRADSALTKEEVLRHYEGKIAKWWMPDDVAFVTSLPLGPTGKVMKAQLREQFKGYRFPSESAGQPGRS